MSKSVGNFIAPQQLVETYGVDPIRYFMLRELPFGNDGDFSHRAVVARLNGDLANDLGNLAQRVLVMINRDCGAAVPEPRALAAADRALLDTARELLRITRIQMSDQAFHLALEAIWRVVGEANRYVDEQAPWVLLRTDPPRMRAVLYVLAETIRHLAILLQPFVPSSAATLLDQLCVPRDRRDFAALGQAPLAPERHCPGRGRFRALLEHRRGERGNAGRQPLPPRFRGFGRRARGDHRRARAAGVATMLTIATRLDQFAGVRAIAEGDDDIWCSVGAHPHEAADHAELRPEELIALAAHPKVVGIGETGLDFHYQLSPRPVQERSFAPTSWPRTRPACR